MKLPFVIILLAAGIALSTGCKSKYEEVCDRFREKFGATRVDDDCVKQVEENIAKLRCDADLAVGCLLETEGSSSKHVYGYCVCKACKEQCNEEYRDSPWVGGKNHSKYEAFCDRFKTEWRNPDEDCVKEISKDIESDGCDSDLLASCLLETEGSSLRGVYGHCTCKACKERCNERYRYSPGGDEKSRN